MKEIKGMYNISLSDEDYFCRELNRKVESLQKDGLEVEIQYQVNSGKNFLNGKLYSALVIGRG
ncbi:MAG: hypothetical protein ACRC1T_05205 [Clostridium chrysemydis]|uniref:hypothetical protein n=1 Tax=Clostridium chrysemydis TaxID=2665504 RepID=UPI003F340ABE